MNIFDDFRVKYPRQVMDMKGRTFPYRYYKNSNSDKTVVLLTGGIGLSDLFLFHFEEFAKSYSVLTFDYPICYPTNQQLAGAIAGLLKALDIKAFLVGQSLGGFIAQIVAQQYPEVVAGLVLSNTGTLSVDLNQQGAQCLTDMLKRMEKSLMLMKLLPFEFEKKSIKRAVLKKVSRQMNEQEQALMAQLCDEMLRILTKEYAIHMTMLMKDLLNNWNMKPDDFICYQNKVLLILSDDDLTFNDDVKQALIDLMPDPQVITDIRGGHLALLLRLEKYAAVVTKFIDFV